MKKIIILIGLSSLVVGCANSPMEQKEYKARLNYCLESEMTVLIEKNEKSRPTNVECVDNHGSTFKSKYKDY